MSGDEHEDVSGNETKERDEMFAEEGTRGGRKVITPMLLALIYVRINEGNTLCYDGGEGGHHGEAKKLFWRIQR